MNLVQLKTGTWHLADYRRQGTDCGTLSCRANNLAYDFEQYCDPETQPIPPGPMCKTCAKIIGTEVRRSLTALNRVELRAAEKLK